MGADNINAAIHCANPKAHFEAQREEVENAIKRVLESGWYILGREVESFEKDFAKYVGANFCASVANGTDALALALRAVGVSPGDEVITVSHSAVATVAAIEHAGAVPVFADIEAGSRCIDPKAVEALISARTRAVVPVHIYGHPANMEALLAIAKKHNLLVVEDCAQAHGARINGRMVGTFGAAAAFSFYPTKNLAALGDGGGVVTNDAAVAERLLLLRQYGWSERYISKISGFNSRLDEIQAAVLTVRLKTLEACNNRRRAIAKQYAEALSGTTLTLPSTAQGIEHAFHLYVVECDDREGLRAHLEARGIHAALHYPRAIHQQPAYQGKVRGGDALPLTERLYERLLSLPMYPELSAGEIARVCEAVRAWEPRR